MAMHTPGPWYRNIKPARKYRTIFADRNTHVAHLETSGLTEEEIEANCALITAAPDLLREAVWALDILTDQYGLTDDCEGIEALKRAIAKATGEDKP